MTRRDDWRSDASCIGTDPEAFFPTSYDTHSVAFPVRVCAACPVAAACLADALQDEGALSARNRAGVRGGLTPRQRHELAAAAARAARGDAEEPVRQPGPLRPIDHGSGGGAAAHRRRGERPCGACRAEESHRRRQRAAARRAAAVPPTDLEQPATDEPAWLTAAHRNRLELDLTREAACAS